MSEKSLRRYRFTYFFTRYPKDAEGEYLKYEDGSSIKNTFTMSVVYEFKADVEPAQIVDFALKLGNDIKANLQKISELVDY